MARVAEGNQHAFRELAARHMHRAYAIARRVTALPQDAEEAVQDAFAKIWINAASFDPDRAAFTTWLYRIVTNACLDIVRKNPPAMTDVSTLENMLSDGMAGAETGLMEKQRSEAVRQAVLSLPPKQRLAVTLCYYEEFTNAEAAAAMGVHIKTVEALLSRARKKLQETLAFPGSYL